MALHIIDPQADTLARELADLTGQTLSDAVLEALQERLRQVQRQRHREVRLEKRREIAGESTILCGRDERNADDIVGYDAAGLPR